MTTIALALGTVGAIGCLVLGAIVTANIYFSLWRWLNNYDFPTRSDTPSENSTQAQKKDPG